MRLTFTLTAVLATLAGCSPDQGATKIDSSPVDECTDCADAGPSFDADTFGGEKVQDAGTINVGGGVRGNALENGKLDLVFVVDNSISMADKQQVFRSAIPDLVNRLVNPVCLDADTGDTHQPSSSDEACPDGMQRQFPAVTDMHVAMISSSLGAAGSEICRSSEQDDDRAIVIGSRARGASIPTYADLGFLAWDPSQAQTPPGESNAPALVGAFQGMVDVVGENGCGFEHTLEAWYRFLVDPEPYETIEVAACGPNNNNPCATPTGVDQEVLDQRAAFLRPDSVVIVMMLTDEDDCSGIPDGQQYYPFRQDITLPRASSACATSTNDPCCYSCGLGVPAGCTDDPICATPLPNADDPLNLRCHRQKERFGIDFLQPVQRYVDGLTQVEVPDRSGIVVRNPLFPEPSGGGLVRAPGNVFLVGIVGVPWQDVATAESLSTAGLLDLKTADEMAADGTWDILLGDPSRDVPPTDPLMIESVTPRTGTNPVTGDALAPPTAGYGANPINGHEWSNTYGDDLQYACVFPLSEPRDCTTVDANVGCDCTSTIDADTKPLCQAPDGSYGTTQYFAKAYPALRILEVLRGAGSNSVVASICPKNISNKDAEDFGYRPVFGKLIQNVAPQLIR